MWYKNIAGRFFGLVTKHACDRRTDGQTANRITTVKTALAQLRRAVTRPVSQLSESEFRAAGVVINSECCRGYS